MGHDFTLARVAESGRISIPAKQRKALGLRQGETVVIDIHDGALRIRRVREVLAELQARVEQSIPNAKGGVEMLLEMRREEAAREEEEYGRYQ